jgi:hypothetical protein
MKNLFINAAAFIGGGIVAMLLFALFLTATGQAQARQDCVDVIIERHVPVAPEPTPEPSLVALQ